MCFLIWLFFMLRCYFAIRTIMSAFSEIITIWLFAEPGWEMEWAEGERDVSRTSLNLLLPQTCPWTSQHILHFSFQNRQCLLSLALQPVATKLLVMPSLCCSNNWVQWPHMLPCVVWTSFYSRINVWIGTCIVSCLLLYLPVPRLLCLQYAGIVVNGWESGVGQWLHTAHECGCTVYFSPG